jgi:hypothetical protein
LERYTKVEQPTSIPVYKRARAASSSVLRPTFVLWMWPSSADKLSRRRGSPRSRWSNLRGGRRGTPAHIRQSPEISARPERPGCLSREASVRATNGSWARYLSEAASWWRSKQFSAYPAHQRPHAKFSIHFSPVLYRSLLQHRIRNTIALLRTSYKRQTVVCSLYEQCSRLFPGFHSTTASLRPRDRGATGSRDTLRRSRGDHDHSGIRGGRNRKGRRCPRPPASTCRGIGCSAVRQMQRPGVQARPALP